MISLLAENKLEHLHQAGAYYRVINNIMVKIIDNSNHTTIIWYDFTRIVKNLFHYFNSNLLHIFLVC